MRLHRPHITGDSRRVKLVSRWLFLILLDSPSHISNTCQSPWGGNLLFLPLNSHPGTNVSPPRLSVLLLSLPSSGHALLVCSRTCNFFTASPDYKYRIPSPSADFTGTRLHSSVRISTLLLTLLYPQVVLSPTAHHEDFPLPFRCRYPRCRRGGRLRSTDHLKSLQARQPSPTQAHHHPLQDGQPQRSDCRASQLSSRTLWWPWRIWRPRWSQTLP